MFRITQSAGHQRPSARLYGWHATKLLLLVMIVTLVAGCQTTAAPNPARTTSESAAQVAAPTPAAAVTAPLSNTNATAAVALPDVAVTTTTLPPVRLAIPALDFATAVEPMAWRVTEVEGERQAVWEVPEASAGWHINSATVGAPDNMLISGHHRQGAAIFAALARGEVAIADQIYVTDSAGATFIYQVSTIAEPIPVSGATAAERAALNAYQAPASSAKLTLLTGWPDFSDTHYLIIIADLVGELE